MAKRATAKRGNGGSKPPSPSKSAGPTILGFLDRIQEASLAGWAVDPARPDHPLSMRAMIDGQVAGVIRCDKRRSDIDALNLPTSRVGFEYAIPPRYQDGLRHVLSFATLEGAPIRLPGRGGFVLPELHFCLSRQVRVEGVLDGLVDGVIQGWALQIDERTGAQTGGMRVLVSTNGEPVAELVADEFRADVADALDTDPACGFSWLPPPELCSGRSVSFEFHAMPSRTLLRGSPIEVGMPSNAERARIEALIDRADDLFRYAYHLRRELKAALPAERFSLAAYQSWVRRNRPLVEARIAARYGERPDQPLVSIVCPVFRPDHGEFLVAIDSVRAQTYPNWELILVDDASRDAALSAVMADLAEADKRIRVLTQGRNGGISTATNRAIEAARGEFVAFFDHDDVLMPCAVDAMMRAQAATGARLLYSDEDKIDHHGHVSEPNFKPDFNYRLLLDINYICHFVLAEAGLIREIGGLDPAMDGAQDHDMLLRACEQLGAHEIHHVPEVLYHWRLTAKSTAASGTAAKPRAAIAGEAAVVAHLKRRNLPAKVERRGKLTCYRTAFRIAADPGVSILIPFRNHIDMTRQCVEATRRHTRKATFEIILLDNWSQGKDAERFTTEQANLPDTTVIRIAEPFNFSMINNRGAAAARHPFLLFMNNDVFVKDPDWLRTMLNEALADPGVGAVGAKLLYPNRTVQHAGVVLGVGGVADHAFRGLPAEKPGYIANAITAREISAITAACMMVRREAFDAVGGFDETAFSVAFNDVDLCLKMRQAGYRIVFTPDAICEHRESQSRGDDFNETKLARFMRENESMRERWGDLLENDPHYNRHFSRDGGVYRDLRVIDPADEHPVSRPVPAARPAAPVRMGETRAAKATAAKPMSPARKVASARRPRLTRHRAPA